MLKDDRLCNKYVGYVYATLRRMMVLIQAILNNFLFNLLNFFQNGLIILLNTLSNKSDKFNVKERKLNWYGLIKRLEDGRLPRLK